ncbi:cation-binding protein [Rubrivivax gelatinosus]|nr:cation-binding protein [Rubrivivax gelatinosus]
MNTLLSKMSPTATRMIRMDHTHAMTQFHKLEPGLSASARQATVRQLCTALEIHAQLEEEVFYPALREAGIDSPQLERSVPEHDEMRELIARVRSLDEEPEAQQQALCELMRAVMHHVAEEETTLLPAAEQRLGERLSELGARMTERRLELAKPQAGQIAADMARSSPGKTALVVAGTLAAGALLVGGMRRGRQKHHA